MATVAALHTNRIEGEQRSSLSSERIARLSIALTRNFLGRLNLNRHRSGAYLAAAWL